MLSGDQTGKTLGKSANQLWECKEKLNFLQFIKNEIRKREKKVKSI